jgi:hypothetical protein
MAYIFELAVECGPNKEDAEAIGKFFEGYQIKVQGSQADLLSLCRVACWQDKENNWWCSIIPSGVSQGLCDNIIKSDGEIFQVKQSLYLRLKSAPFFRYAICEFEITPFDTYSRLLREQGTDRDPLQGLVLNRQIWEDIGRPQGYEPFRENAFWIPISMPAK